MSHRIVWALLAGAVVFACSEVGDAPTTTSITGRVLDESGVPIADAEVSSVPTTQTALTDDDGRFRLDEARFTVSYVVSAEKDGFQLASAVVTPTALGPNEVELVLPVQEICAAGERRCAVGGIAGVETCNEDGNEFGPPSLCAEGDSCDPIDATCKGAFSLTVTGNPFGVVRSEPSGINCGVSCDRAFVAGTQVTLTALALGLGQFDGWGGDCASAGTASMCTVTMDADRSVTADFSSSAFPVQVRTVGNGEGRVTSMPAGIDCGSTCQATFDRDTTITLTAQAVAGFEFETWLRDCQSAGSNPTCTLTVDEPKDVRARFRVPTFSLGVTKVGTGAGTVTSDPGGIDCGGTCTTDLSQGTMVTLTAVADGGSTFEGWSGGGCAGQDPTCTITLDADRTVNARFDGITFPLAVANAGNGVGRVTSDPAGIDCGSTCTTRFSPGTMVRLTATPAGDSGFAGWQGDCAGVGDCSLTMDAARSATAVFEPFFQFPLAADADCLVGLSFDGANPLDHRCGVAGMATLSGTYQRIQSRTTALDQAYTDDQTAAGYLNTERVLSSVPDATLEMTVRLDGNALDASGRAILVSDVDAALPAGGLRLLVLDDGTLAVQVWQGGRPSATATAAAALTSGQWAHVAATVSSAQGLGLFVDGQRVVAPVGSVTWTASSSTAWVGAERNGVSGSRHRLNGAFDEVRLSRGVRY